jgi:beta-phosphoglucomutase family hydrolase
MLPQALIFDVDGTLADSMPLHWEAWQALIRRHHFQFSEERFYALGGVPSRDIIKAINCEQGLALDPLEVAREKELEYLARLDRVAPIASIVNIAREHHGKVPLAIATGGSRRVVQQVLDHLRLRPLFDAVVTNEDVTRQKPAPDIFLEAARRLGVPAAQCRAFEDTDLGLQAIRAAGMDAVDVRVIIQPLVAATHTGT